MNEEGSFREWAAENQGRLLIGLVVIVALFAGGTGWIVGRTHGDPSATGGATRSAIVDEFADESDGAAFPSAGQYAPPPAVMGSPTVSAESFRRVDTAEAYDRRIGRSTPGGDAWPAPMGESAGPSPTESTDPSASLEAGQAIVNPHPLLRPAEVMPLASGSGPDARKSPGGSSSAMPSTQHFGPAPTPPPLMGALTIRTAEGEGPKADAGARVVVYAVDGAWSKDRRLDAVGALNELMDGREPFREVKADGLGQFWVADLAPGEYIVAFESGRSASTEGEEEQHFCHAERVTIVRGQPLTLSFEFDASGRAEA